MARSTHALGRALIELVQERHFDSITVQQILDRAGVGRATFYAHYRNKEDVLHSSYERLFAAFDGLLDRSPRDERLFPVAELLVHVREAGAVVDALDRTSRLDEAWALFAGHAARTIARRLAALGGAAGVPAPLAGRMLAGALVEAIAWWRDHPAAATPAQMDAAFHGLARGMLARRPGAGAAP